MIGSPAGGGAFGAIAVEAGGATWRYAASGVLPDLVVTPASVEEMAEVVRVVGDRAESLIPVGKGARLSIGNAPRRYDVALSTEKLASLQHHVADDLTVTVQAGMTLQCLNEALAAHGQWLPIDPAAAAETTVGGLIAADASGPLRYSHGKVRDFLLGIEFVNGAGEVVRAGGRVVKNVAGYDFGKLLCGSFGTLGTIVAATFKTRPRPAVERLYLWICADVGEACRRALHLDALGLAAAYLEALGEAACEAIGLECPAALAIGVAGSQAEVDAQAASLRDTAGAHLSVWDVGKEAGVLQAIRNFSLPVNDDAVVGRLAVQPVQLAELLARIEAEAGSRGAVVDIAAHAAIGVARCQIVGAGDAERAALFAEWLRLTVRQRGGWVTYESMPKELRGHLDCWGMSGPTVALMRGVKQVFDPRGLFSPGRFVGGI